MIRLAVVALLVVLASSYLTLAFVDLDAARDVGITYSIVVATCSLALHYGDRDGR